MSKDSVASHERFKGKHRLNFPLLSDPQSEAMRAYGAWGKKKMYGREVVGTIRSTFIIDERGKIASVFPKVKVDGHVEDVLQVIEKGD